MGARFRATIKPSPSARDTRAWAGNCCVLVPQAYQGVAARRVYRRIKVLDSGFVQRLQGATEDILVDELGAALPGDLQGGVRRVQVGRCIEQAQQQKEQDEQVFPQRVLIQHVGALAGGYSGIPVKKCVIIKKRPRATRLVVSPAARARPSPASAGRCGTGASSHRPLPTGAAPRSTARCGTPARGGAS